MNTNVDQSFSDSDHQDTNFDLRSPEKVVKGEQFAERLDEIINDEPAQSEEMEREKLD